MTIEGIKHDDRDIKKRCTSRFQAFALYQHARTLNYVRVCGVDESDSVKSISASSHKMESFLQ